MAQRRMFAKTIIDSDSFLDMPLSTQSLYFHLSMRADDDGFINNPKKIQRMIGASDDDFRLLIHKNFLIPFESGIVVIKHWKIHNYIQNDRYKETVYLEEKNQLKLKENNSYTLNLNEVSEMDTKCIQGVSNMYPSIETTETEEIAQNQGIEPMDTEWIQNGDTGKVRLGKDRLGKVRLGEVRINYQQIADMYNDTCVSFPRLTTLSDSRKKAIKARLNQHSIEDIQKVFEKAQASDFLKGANSRNWMANFDWMMKDSNMAKILDGNYDNKMSGKQSDQLQQSYDMMSNWAEG